MAGPTGTHLFHSSKGSADMDMEPAVEVDLVFEDTKNIAITPLCSTASKLDAKRRDTPVPIHVEDSRQDVAHPDGDVFIDVISAPQKREVVDWTPQDVVMWLQKMNTDESIVEKFFINDISGSVLLKLQSEDLKELDIQSFGKRHGLMNSIRQLHRSVSPPFTNSHLPIPSESVSWEAKPESTGADLSFNCSATLVRDDEGSVIRNKEHTRRRRHRRRPARAIRPDDSVSIVSIDQVLSKIHMCSKGPECGKWQKEHAKLSRMARGLPLENFYSQMVENAATARNLIEAPNSDATLWLVGSCDDLGPNQSTDIPPKKRPRDIQPLDPRGKLSNLLEFQRPSRLHGAAGPATPPKETLPSPDADSPGSLKEHLGSLPKLQIPSNRGLSLINSTFSPNLSGQRTVTPSVYRKKVPFQDSIPERPGDSFIRVLSPSDFYRQDPNYVQLTPLSKVDAPLTAIAMRPLEREYSQSTPPDMNFGNFGRGRNDPIPRPISTKVDKHRRKPSSNSSNNTPTLTRLDESQILESIGTFVDLERTPRAFNHRVNPFSPSMTTPKSS